MKKVIGWILVVLGGFLCIDGVVCIPVAFTADDMSLGERIFALCLFIAVAVAGGLICRKGFRLKAGKAKRDNGHENSPGSAA